MAILKLVDLSMGVGWHARDVGLLMNGGRYAALRKELAVTSKRRECLRLTANIEIFSEFKAV